MKDVEPKYNSSLSKLRENKIDAECIYAIGGFAAYVSSCAPAAMRIHSEPLRRVVEAESAILDKQGALTKAPAALGGKSLPELLEEGIVKIEIDPTYPQALGISTITNRLSIFGNSRWEVLRNEEADSPFFTSDYPVAIEPSNDPRVSNRIVPLAPDLAVRIVPNIELSRKDSDLSFGKFSSIQRTLRQREVLELNRLIVQCAEDNVFYRDDHYWIAKFIAKNRNYRIETVTGSIPHGTGVGLWFSQRVVSHQPSAFGADNEPKHK